MVNEEHLLQRVGCGASPTMQSLNACRRAVQHAREFGTVIWFAALP